MSQITDYADKVETFVSDVKGDLTAISAQAKALQDQITALQGQIANGTLAAADQAALDKLVSDSGTLAAAADAAAGKVATPPPAPAATA